MNSLKVIFGGVVAGHHTWGGSWSCPEQSQSLVAQSVGGYVALIRQVPLLLQLLFWYFVAFLGLPDTPVGGLIHFSNQGIRLLGLNLSVEFCSVLTGLVVFTGASIAEIVRGGINAVSRGQWEAFRSLGLSEGLGLRRIVLPQALPAILPALQVNISTLRRTARLPLRWALPISTR